MKGYKVFNPDWTCRGKQYSCPGIFEQEGELELCKNGIHFCKKLIDCFNYYSFNPKNKVAEIEAVGEIIKDEDEGKYCTSKIKIIRELNWHEVLNLVNIGIDNTGLGNSGDCNTGDYNTGFRNSGNRNTGNFNSGDYNFGSCNSGNCNTGSFNIGDYNSGRGNSGNYNSGENNSGNFNSGYYNTGNYNTGNGNAGNYNTGDYNSSDSNTGCFNTEKNKVNFFNKQSDWTYEDWLKSKAKWILDTMVDEDFKNRLAKKEKQSEDKIKEESLYKERVEFRQKWWTDLSKEDKDSILNLPNFDAKIFKKITGIDVTIEK